MSFSDPLIYYTNEIAKLWHLKRKCKGSKAQRPVTLLIVSWFSKVHCTEAYITDELNLLSTDNRQDATKLAALTLHSANLKA